VELGLSIQALNSSEEQRITNFFSEVKRMISIPVLCQAALSMQKESRFDDDLGSKFEANHRGLL